MTALTAQVEGLKAPQHGHTGCQGFSSIITTVIGCEQACQHCCGIPSHECVLSSARSADLHAKFNVRSCVSCDKCGAKARAPAVSRLLPAQYKAGTWVLSHNAQAWIGRPQHYYTVLTDKTELL